MTTARRPVPPGALPDRFVRAVADRLRENRRVRRSLPFGGRVHVDRQLPFLCVFRRDAQSPVPGAARLVTSQAAYLIAPAERAALPGVRRLVGTVASVMADVFGAFLIVEVWEGDMPDGHDPETHPSPRFEIHHAPRHTALSTIDTLRDGLARVRVTRKTAEVRTVAATRVSPPGLRRLLDRSDPLARRGFVIGIEVTPVYRDPASGTAFPAVLRSLRRQLGRALYRAFYDFAHNHTTHRPRHFHSLGRRAMVKAVWEADERLAAVNRSFDLLYLATPMNVERAWRAFRRKRHEQAPPFTYRPAPIDVSAAKRKLFAVRMESIEDPTLQRIFVEKQVELDRQLSMVRDRGTAGFLHGSLQLHGPVSTELLRTARETLRALPVRERAHAGRPVAARAFAERAVREIESYRGEDPAFDATAEVRDDLFSGEMVSGNTLLIGSEVQVPPNRVDALIHHEVGTHLLTYHNGCAQRLRMLSVGLPGYDELQEGLAVFSEYLSGGLTAGRVRTLAARVVAAHAAADGASFVETFRVLHREHGFTQRAAYTIAMRVHRGGGMVKDAVYLRGLLQLLDHLAGGGEWSILFIGKIALRHLPVMRELIHRRVLVSPPLTPRCLRDTDARERLQRVSNGCAIADLVNG
jgi:uncharacterized protein (TIGR02421 family)